MICAQHCRPGSRGCKAIATFPAVTGCGFYVNFITTVLLTQMWRKYNQMLHNHRGKSEDLHTCNETEKRKAISAVKYLFIAGTEFYVHIYSVNNIVAQTNESVFASII